MLRMTNGSDAFAAATSAARWTRSQPASAMASASSNERWWICRACASRCGSAVKYPGTSLINSQASARIDAASSTAVRSEPPRPSDVMVPPALTPRKPGTMTMRAEPSAASRRSGRTVVPVARSATSPVWCTLNGTACVPMRCRWSASKATDRSSPVDQSRSKTSWDGSSMTACASASNASVPPYCAETITTRRWSGCAARRSWRKRAAAAYDASSRRTEPPSLRTLITTGPPPRARGTPQPLRRWPPGRRRPHAPLGDDLRNIVQQRGRGDVGSGPRTDVALRTALGVDDDTVGHAGDARERVGAGEKCRPDVRPDRRAVPGCARNGANRAVECRCGRDVVSLDAGEAVQRNRSGIDEQAAEQADENRELFGGVRAADVHRGIGFGVAKALRVGKRRLEAATARHRGQDVVGRAVQDCRHTRRARDQRAALERAEEGHARDTRRLIAERRAASPRQPRELVAVRGDQRLVRRHDGNAAIERAPHERIRRLDAAQRFDDDVDRFRKERLVIVGNLRGQLRGTLARHRADESGRDDGSESPAGERRRGLARQAREGGAHVAEAQKADAAGGGMTSGDVFAAEHRSAGRQIEHGRSHDETLQRDHVIHRYQRATLLLCDESFGPIPGDGPRFHLSR